MSRGIVVVQTWGVSAAWSAADVIVGIQRNVWHVGVLLACVTVWRWNLVEDESVPG
jgi:hypothetical protein